MTEQKSTAFLDGRIFTHRVNYRQPTEYGIAGLKYEGPPKSGVPRPHDYEDKTPLGFTWTVALLKIKA